MIDKTLYVLTSAEGEYERGAPIALVETIALAMEWRASSDPQQQLYRDFGLADLWSAEEMRAWITDGGTGDA